MSSPELVHDRRISDHVVHSTTISQVFKIRVQQPMRRADETERFPVVYITDGDDFFDALAAIANMLQILGEAPRFILVGIGYGDARRAQLLRMRDLHTHSSRALFQAEIRQLATSPFGAGFDDLTAIFQTTDAKEFLIFIREELMPFIAAHYPTLAGDNTYSGYSAGGGFGLYTLFTHPNAFQRYILGSPTTSYRGRNFGINLAEAFIASGQIMDAALFMSVGELEEFKSGHQQFDLVTGYYTLAKFLMKPAFSALDLKLRVFPGETHATAWTLSFIHGIKTLFGSAHPAPFMPKTLE